MCAGILCASATLTLYSHNELRKKKTQILRPLRVAKLKKRKIEHFEVIELICDDRIRTF